MQNITFNNVELTLVKDSTHEFLLSNKDVAVGYGVSVSSLREHKSSHSDELIEGKHFIIDKSYRNTPKIMWTSLGVYHLGFFIKSKQAKEFRKFMASVANAIDPYKINDSKETEELKRIILEQNRLIANSQTQSGMSELCQLLNDYAPPAFHKRLTDSLKNIKDIADGKMSIGDGVLIDPIKLMEQGIKYDALQLKYELLHKKYKQASSNLIQFESDMENSVELISSLHKKLGIFTERIEKIKIESVL